MIMSLGTLTHIRRLDGVGWDGGDSVLGVRGGCNLTLLLYVIVCCLRFEELFSSNFLDAFNIFYCYVVTPFFDNFLDILNATSPHLEQLLRRS